MEVTRNTTRTQCRAEGFTLIEVCVVMVIIAILAAIAYPSYISYKVRANRTAAQVVLMDLASRQQQYFIDARGYSADLAALGHPTTGADIAPVYTIDSPTVDNSATPPSYMVTASPRSGTVQANDGQLRLTSTGAKSRGTLQW
jgi:type IV pilus assembly protein PilE